MTRVLSDIEEQVKVGAAPAETVRQLLRRLGFEKRGYHKVRQVRHALAAANLETHPDFNSVPLDAQIVYSRPEPPVLVHDEASKTAAAGTNLPHEPNTDSPSLEDPFESADPTYRMNRLDDGGQELLSIRPDEQVRRATTLMMSHDYSQLPVISGAHTLKGVISWRSLGIRFALGGRPELVRDAMQTDVTTVESEMSLFRAIPRIIESDYALVRRSDGSYWIVTTADLSGKFRDLAEPFLLLAEIENQLRRLLDRHLSKATIRAAKDPEDTDRRIESSADLTLGEVLRVLESEDAWALIAPALDRVEVTKQLDRIRNIRNDVMHFDPEGVGSDDLQALRTFARFLQDFHRYEPRGARQS